MNTLDQDLRWDLRYGVQMFCKHFLWLLKYTSLALIGGAVAIVLAAWIWSGVRIWQKEKRVQQAWVGDDRKNSGCILSSKAAAVSENRHE